MRREPRGGGGGQILLGYVFSVFGILRRSVAAFEESVRQLGRQSGYIDLFWMASALERLELRVNFLLVIRGSYTFL